LLFKSPCEVITEDIVHPDLLKQTRKQCDEMYEEYFLSEIENMCPRGSFNIVQSRKKRFVFSLLIATLCVSVIVPIALGISAQVTASAALSRTDSLTATMNKQEGQLEEIAEKLNLHAHAIEELQDGINSFRSKFDAHEKDYNILKARQSSASFIISYVTSKLLDAKPLIRDTARKWKQHKLNIPFFEYLNVSMDCGQDCPLNHGYAQSCRLSSDRKKLHLQFTVPIVNQTLKLVEADPFRILHQTENSNCSVEYSGPRNAIMSTNKNCVYSVNLDFHDIILSPPSKCQPVIEEERSKYFHVARCYPKRENDALEFVQVLFIYFIPCRYQMSVI